MKGLSRFIPRRIGARREIVVEDLSQNLVPIIGARKIATVIHNLFTPQECADLISMTEQRGFKEAMIHGLDGDEVLRKDIRNSGRCIIDYEELAQAWYQRVMSALEDIPSVKENIVHANHVSGTAAAASGNTRQTVCGLNERLRFLRYVPGQYFSKHQDNSYRRGPEFVEREGETSYLTFLLYLNEGFKGGETRFVGGDRWLDVIPRVGSVLVFDHDIHHKAVPIISGKKYCCRSDIMYSVAQR